MRDGRIVRVFETEILCLMGNFETIPAIGIEIAPREGGEPFLLGLLKGFTNLTPLEQDVVRWDDTYAEIFMSGILRAGRFERQGIALIDIRDCALCGNGPMDFVNTPSSFLPAGRTRYAHWLCRACGDEVYPKLWSEGVVSGYARGDHVHRRLNFTGSGNTVVFDDPTTSLVIVKNC